MLNKYVFAVVGALGNVGTEMRSILETSDLPIKKLVLMDVPQQAGKKIRWRDENFTVVESQPEDFSGVDIAIMGAETEASLELSPEVVKRGGIVIDNYTAFRMALEYTLVIPEVNAEQLVNHQTLLQIQTFHNTNAGCNQANKRQIQS